MNRSYNDTQWRWVNDRRLEGYTIESLCQFLHVHRMTLSRNLQRLGLMPMLRSDLPPLEEMRVEFMRMEVEHE